MIVHLTTGIINLTVWSVSGHYIKPASIDPIEGGFNATFSNRMCDILLWRVL